MTKTRCGDNVTTACFVRDENLDCSLLQGRVRYDGVAEVVFVLVAVRMAAGDLDLAGVVVGGDAVSRVTQRVAVGTGVGEDVSDVVTGDAQLEAVAVAGQASVVTVVVGFAAADRDGADGLFEVPAVIGILMSVTVREFVSGAGALFGSETVCVTAGSGGIGVLLALAVVNHVVFRGAADQFDARVLIARCNAGLDAVRITVDHDAVVGACHGDALEGDVVVGGWDVESVGRGSSGEVKGRGTFDSYATWHRDFCRDSIGSGNGDRSA